MPTYLAPTLSICSFTSGRTSVALTLAPRRRAVAIACSPATAAPTTNTLAGGTIPAAVISIGKYLGSSAAASSTPRYPAMFACEDSVSMGWARGRPPPTRGPPPPPPPPPAPPPPAAHGRRVHAHHEIRPTQ